MTPKVIKVSQEAEAYCRASQTAVEWHHRARRAETRLERANSLSRFDFSMLSEREELIISLVYGMDWSLSRVARAIGVSPQIVSAQHARAMQALRAHGKQIIACRE